MVNLGNDWDELLKNEFQEEYYLSLRKFLIEEYRNHTVYPDMYDIFNAFKYSSYDDTKIVIFGQDPYHEPNQAHGLAFSVKYGVKIPPSLVNIYKELNAELGCYIPNNGNLTKWAKQGVMLLNTSLPIPTEIKAGSFLRMPSQKYTIKEKSLLYLCYGVTMQRKK